MRVLVYDDRPDGNAEEVAELLRERLPQADVVAYTKRQVRLLEEPEVDVIVLPLEALEPEPQPDALTLLSRQHPEALVVVTIGDRPREDLVRLALSRDVRAFVVDDSPATLAVLVTMVAAEREPHPSADPSRDPALEHSQHPEAPRSR